VSKIALTEHTLSHEQARKQPRWGSPECAVIAVIPKGQGLDTNRLIVFATIARRCGGKVSCWDPLVSVSNELNKSGKTK
jgi:hypothetical protein